MSKEVDINAEPTPEEAKPKVGDVFNWDDWEHFQTDVNLHITFLGNPIYWLRAKILWGEFDGYGFVIGPLVVNVMIHKLIRPKQK